MGDSMVRDWLMKPEIVLWAFGFVPVVLLLLYVSVMGIRSRRRAERPLRMTIWLLPAVVLFMAYYMWGFQMPLVKAVLYVGAGALLCRVGAFMLDIVYVGTTRLLSGGAGERQNSDDPSFNETDSGSEPGAQSRVPRS